MLDQKAFILAEFRAGKVGWRCGDEDDAVDSGEGPDVNDTVHISLSSVQARVMKTYRTLGSK